MMIKLSIGNNYVLLTPDKMAQLLPILEECTLYNEKHVGTNKGFTGYDNSYVVELKPFVASQHLVINIFSQQEVDKYIVLQAMREGEQP